MFKNISLFGYLGTFFFLLLPFIDTEKSLPYGAVNSKYFYIVLFVALIGIYFSYKLFQGKISLNLRKRYLLISLVGVIFIHYLSAFLGVDFYRSLWSDILRSTGLLFLSAIALMAFFLSELLNKNDWVLLRRGIIFSTTLFSFLIFFAQDGSGLTFGNSTFAGAYILIGFILTLIEFFNAEKGTRLKKMFLIMAFIQLFSPLFINLKILFTDFSAIFSNPALILGSARASGATAIIAFIYVLVLSLIKKFAQGNSKKVIVIWTAGFVLAVSSALYLLFIPGSFIQDKYIESSTAARIIIWDSGLDAFESRPWLGWGPENFRYAYERNFNSDLHLEENIGEVWFDRAHNIIIDTLVSVGGLGLLVILFTLIYFIFVLKKAYNKNVIGTFEATLLGMLVFFHFLQLQTAFDTPATYALVGLLFGYVLWLEKRVAEIDGEDNNGVIINNNIIHKVGAGVVLVFIIFGFYKIGIEEYGRQKSLSRIFSVFDQKVQLESIDDTFDGKIDFESLRLTSNSSIRGFLDQASAVNPEQELVLRSLIKSQLDVYGKYYSVYLSQSPDDYRMRMNYAHLLLMKTVLGENRIDEAKEIISNSYDLSPNNPLTYALDSLASLFGGDLNGAKEKINKGLEIDPDIEFTQGVYEYIKEQEKRFPHIAIIRMRNL